MSARSDLSTTWNEDMRHVDTVLDVERLASAAVHLGAHVTVVRIDGGLHDLVLSEEPVRAEVFEQMRTWRDAWVTPHSRTRAANHCKKDGALRDLICWTEGFRGRPCAWMLTMRTVPLLM